MDGGTIRKLETRPNSFLADGLTLFKSGRSGNYDRHLGAFSTYFLGRSAVPQLKYTFRSLTKGWNWRKYPVQLLSASQNPWLLLRVGTFEFDIIFHFIISDLLLLLLPIVRHKV